SSHDAMRRACAAWKSCRARYGSAPAQARSSTSSARVRSVTAGATVPLPVRRAALLSEVLFEKGDHPLPRVGRGSGIVPVALSFVEEGVLRPWIDLVFKTLSMFLHGFREGGRSGRQPLVRFPIEGQHRAGQLRNVVDRVRVAPVEDDRGIHVRVRDGRVDGRAPAPTEADGPDAIALHVWLALQPVEERLEVLI